VVLEKSFKRPHPIFTFLFSTWYSVIDEDSFLFKGCC
jgi:hypothetical protein